MGIDVHFEEHQVQLGEAARNLFAQRNTSGTIRSLEDGEVGYDPDLWRTMAELGWLGLAIDEQCGGGGAGFLELYRLFEEIGRALVGGPHIDTLGVAVPLIDRLGSDVQRRTHLGAIASGDMTVATGVLEADGALTPAGVHLRAEQRHGSWVLSGTKVLVPYASSVSHLLVAARTGQGVADARPAITLFLVPVATTGIVLTRLSVIPGVPMYAVGFDNVSVGDVDRLGPEGEGWSALESAMTEAAVLQTAMIVGAAREVLDVTARYARDREQFGIPIGKNQAVQYMVSDILIDLHRADLLGRQAAFRIDTKRPSTREASIAAACAKEASAHYMRQAHEVHAGVAFINEHDLTLYSRMGKFWETHLGDARHYRELLGQAVL